MKVPAWKSSGRSLRPGSPTHHVHVSGKAYA
jgi:hypothetical protein